MKIVYMGTPDFAVPALEMLVDSDQDVKLVVTKPDKAQKRGKKVMASPVKIKAQELGIPVAQPDQVKGNEDFFNQVTNACPDLIVVAAYGKILPLDILNIPAFGAINIHASILPKFRGAAPIHRAVEKGEKETGVTLMYMSEGMDEGDMIAVSRTSVDGKTTGELHDQLAQMGADLLRSKLDDIQSGNIQAVSQDDRMATYAPMIEKEDAHIDFNKRGIEIERLIRAMTPFPGAFSYLDDKKVKIIEAEVLEYKGQGEAGQILNASETIDIKAGDKSLIRINKLQMPGKKPMETEAFLRGNKLEKGRILR